jgi:anti-anti-sigma factor
MAEGFELNVSERDGVTVLRFAGHLESAAIAQAQEKLGDHITAGTALILDLSALDYMSSVGLRLILKALKQAQAVQQPFVIVGPRGRVKEVLDTTGLSKFCPIFPRLDAAIESLQ